MFNIEYYNRYNQRIFVNSDLVGGTPATGAISDIVSTNLTPNVVLISSAAGKIIASSGDASKITNLNDTTGPIGAALSGKEPTLTKGNVSEVTSSVLTITGGTGAVIGSGLNITVKQATTGQAGYLSSADWNTFNNKLSSSLANGKIWVGDGGGIPQQITLSQDVTIDNLGAATIANNAITNVKVAAAAAIAVSKLGALSNNASVGLAVVTDASGVLTTLSGVSSTKVGYLTDVTSNLQAQLTGKLSVSLGTPATGDIIYFNGTSWVNLARGSNGQVLASTSTTIQWQAGTSNGLPAGGTTGQYLNKIDGTNYNAQWSTLTLAKITDVTASVAQVNVLSNGYYDASSPLQAQIDGKLSKYLTQNSIFVGNPSGIAAQVSSGPNGYILTSVGGTPTWLTPPAGMFLKAKVVIAGGATLRGIGTSPQTIIAAPGAGKFINIIDQVFSYKYGSAAYNFTAAVDYPFLHFSGITEGIIINTTNIDGAIDFNNKGGSYSNGFQNQPTNTALIFGTTTNANASTGDGDLEITVYYTIEDANP